MAGILTYSHTQASPSTTWTVNHNLGRKPNVDVVIDFNGGKVTMLPREIKITSANQVVITFSSAQSGIARLS